MKIKETMIYLIAFALGYLIVYMMRGNGYVNVCTRDNKFDNILSERVEDGKCTLDEYFNYTECNTCICENGTPSSNASLCGPWDAGTREHPGALYEDIDNYEETQSKQCESCEEGYELVTQSYSYCKKRLGENRFNICTRDDIFDNILSERVEDGKCQLDEYLNYTDCNTCICENGTPSSNASLCGPWDAGTREHPGALYEDIDNYEETQIYQCESCDEGYDLVTQSYSYCKKIPPPPPPPPPPPLPGPSRSNPPDFTNSYCNCTNGTPSENILLCYTKTSKNKKAIEKCGSCDEGYILREGPNGTTFCDKLKDGQISCKNKLISNCSAALQKSEISCNICGGEHVIGDDCTQEDVEKYCNVPLLPQLSPSVPSKEMCQSCRISEDCNASAGLECMVPKDGVTNETNLLNLERCTGLNLIKSDVAIESGNDSLLSLNNSVCYPYSNPDKIEKITNKDTNNILKIESTRTEKNISPLLSDDEIKRREQISEECICKGGNIHIEHKGIIDEIKAGTAYTIPTKCSSEMPYVKEPSCDGDSCSPSPISPGVCNVGSCGPGYVEKNFSYTLNNPKPYDETEDRFGMICVKIGDNASDTQCPEGQTQFPAPIKPNVPNYCRKSDGTVGTDYGCSAITNAETNANNAPQLGVNNKRCVDNNEGVPCTCMGGSVDLNDPANLNCTAGKPYVTRDGISKCNTCGSEYYPGWDAQYRLKNICLLDGTLADDDINRF